MAFGPGKYDDACTLVREQLKAQGVIVVVLGGEHGDGFSAQVTVQDLILMPDILRNIAKQIENS